MLILFGYLKIFELFEESYSGVIEVVDLVYEFKSVVDYFVLDCMIVEVVRGEVWDESWFDNLLFDVFIYGFECKC